MYELLSGNNENDHYDGQAFELANSTTIKESQVIELKKETVLSEEASFIKKKCEASLQQREVHRCEQISNPQQDDDYGGVPPLSSFFKEIVTSDKQMSIEVTLRKEASVNKRHIYQTLSLLSTLYPEVKKAKRLSAIIMGSSGIDYIPCEIKIPVVSTLGIKAIIQISPVNYTRFSDQEAYQFFESFKDSY